MSTVKLTVELTIKMCADTNTNAFIRFLQQTDTTPADFILAVAEKRGLNGLLE